MAKLIVLALAFAALVAFATAHTTIITTTIEDENPISGQRQCSQRIQGQRLNQCRMFLQQGQNIPREFDNPQMGRQQQEQQLLQQCCQELQNIDQQCQCEAVKQVFREAQQQVQQQQGPQSVPFLHSQQAQRLKQKAQILPNVCNLQSRRCEIGTITTTVTESNIDIPFRDRPFGTGSQQCRETEIQRPVSQCQRYVEQQMQSPMPYIRRPGQQQQEPELQQCCNELQNVKRECQCEAVQEVARRVMRQPQQHQQQRRGQFGGQEMDIARRVIQNLPNQCSLQVQQCNIPY
ncbi:putative bifunctional inhibitor/plant lipid transfer protein/seed storage helical [Helianthus annuus]|uniref:Bifunctional inhibitor/plant lipid transfer protein/seed storage helical n=1 Tax=Helianthus annuus TaxID=4232 RepID=A0A161CT49_HELAN|nr:2S seed storage protein-like [Helianthus annuus]ALO17643.1 seed storage albumin 20 precursor [Helianthus annuus]KAF5781090.1 putative bifunctional inhibitor/plant lipid transfer protein/seed storage helical [Helianthus annuus]KAJ0500770.1 putative AAI/SS protein [Helianthus annuus]KAJ0508368.1 putative bifunctional inhibitor/plant lipid transfer protein/seed storage helical [Helianthus annuus]KAJ0516639.1 putative AAI/SS protein [Helianthus annuus]